MKQRWGQLGEGYNVPVCEIDLRVGGRWRFVNRHPKEEVAFCGEYRKITPPSRVVFTEIFEQFSDTISVVMADLIEEGDKTRLTATVVRDIVVASGMACGAGISYDRLEV